MLMPFGILFLKRWYAEIYSFVLIFLIIISGFVVEGIGIFLLFIVPVLTYNNFKNKVIKHMFITIFSIISFSLMYYFFGYMIPDFFINKNLIWLLFLLYIIFSNVYGFLLSKLKNEIDSIIKKD
jgi:hypothetical protein